MKLFDTSSPEVLTQKAKALYHEERESLPMPLRH